MESNPTVTIITPVFNGAKYIEETIYSVLNAKTNVRFEYIVIDDGSTDNTYNKINNFKKLKRIKFLKIFKNNKNLGFARACLKAAKLGKG